MKVLLFDTTQSYFFPGGKLTHAKMLQKEISKLGVDIQFANWWDPTQKDFDLIHFLSPNVGIAAAAKQFGKKTFFSMIFDFETNKSSKEQKKMMLKNRILDKFPSTLTNSLYWHALPYMDCIQFMHKYDRDTALKYFPKHINSSKTIIIPHGHSPEEMNISMDLDVSEMKFPQKYLISCANISERKQTVLLAKYAKLAQTPIVFMGSANKESVYFKAFEKEVDNKYVFYPGFVSKEWKDCIERNASGYALLSLGESGCIAVYEAAAYNMPLFLSNLPWAWGYEAPTDIYFCDYRNEQKAVEQLKDFYQKACKLDHMPFCSRTWSELAKMYIKEYERLLNN